MRVLLTGADGQLGYDIQKTVPDVGRLTALNRGQLDITDAASVMQLVGELRPDVVINAAAYTAVDTAETEPEKAHHVNVDGSHIVASACSHYKSRLIHLSTDYVFDGTSNLPYKPDNTTNPHSVYGRTKLDGERAIRAVVPLHANIIRVSWLYGEHGGNFVLTMLKLMNEREELGVVTDQIGAPTWTKTLAESIWKLAFRADLQSTWHWSDLGVCSWYDFAVAIYEIGTNLGLLNKRVRIRPIATADYPTPARRPVFSVLDSTDLRQALEVDGAHWRENLMSMLKLKVNA